MAVNLIWSYSNGGSAISDYVDHGDVSNGSNTTAQEIFLRHDGSAAITGAKLYIREYSGTYNGDATATADFTEIIAWGNDSTAAGFGGVMIHWGATDAPAYSSDWPTLSVKTQTSSFVHVTGVGDSESNAVTLPISTGVSTAGQIETGSAPNVRFKMRIAVPTDEDTVGIRLFDHVCSYTYTS